MYQMVLSRHPLGGNESITFILMGVYPSPRVVVTSVYVYNPFGDFVGWYTKTEPTTPLGYVSIRIGIFAPAGTVWKVPFIT